MRVRALLLSIIFMFGEVSAGQAAFVVPIIVAGISAASGRPTRCGFACDGNGGNFRTESSFTTKDGTTFTSRSDAWDKYKPNPNAYKHPEEKVRQEFEARKKYEETHRFKEEKFDADSVDDIEDFVFGKQKGYSYSKFTSEKESYDCMMDGDEIYLSTTNSRGFNVVSLDGDFDSFSTFTPDTEDGRKAVKSFIFQETPLIWHFDRKNINGKWFNHAWTDSNEDYLIPEGQKFYVHAPSWYTEKRHAEAKINETVGRNAINQDLSHYEYIMVEAEARRNAETLARINENAGLGFFEEFLWSNVRAVNSVFKDDAEAGRDAINQGLSYYEYAMNAWNNPELNCFSEQGMENIRKFGASEISGQQFLDKLREEFFTGNEDEFLEDLEAAKTASTIGAGIGAVAGGAAGAEAGPGGIFVGASRGAKWGRNAGFFGTLAVKELKRRLNPQYACAGGPSSKFKDFENLRKPANNAPRNAKGSGGSGSQGPSVKEAGKAPRNASTRQDADNYINGLKGKLSQKGVTKDGYEYYKVMEKVEYKGIKFKKGDYLSRDELHHEWEWFRGKDKHQGAIDSITGKLFEDSAVKSRALKLP